MNVRARLYSSGNFGEPSDTDEANPRALNGITGSRGIRSPVDGGCDIHAYCQGRRQLLLGSSAADCFGRGVASTGQRHRGLSQNHRTVWWVPSLGRVCQRERVDGQLSVSLRPGGLFQLGRGDLHGCSELGEFTVGHGERHDHFCLRACHDDHYNHHFHSGAASRRACHHTERRLFESKLARFFARDNDCSDWC